jgi:hypothetical protein
LVISCNVLCRRCSSCCGKRCTYPVWKAHFQKLPVLRCAQNWKKDFSDSSLSENWVFELQKYNWSSRTLLFLPVSTCSRVVTNVKVMWFLLYPKLFAYKFQTHSVILNIFTYIVRMGTANGGAVVKVLCYKSEGRWFDSRWCHWNFSLI